MSLRSQIKLFIFALFAIGLIACGSKDNSNPNSNETIENTEDNSSPSNDSDSTSENTDTTTETVVETTVCENVFVGNILTVIQVKSFSEDFCAIDGSVKLENTDITHLDQLKNVSEITGSLDLSNNSKLSNLDGLKQLTKIGGTLQIDNNSLLLELDGLSALKVVGSSIIIQNNEFLESVEGLNSVERVGLDNANPEDKIFYFNNNDSLRVIRLALKESCSILISNHSVLKIIDLSQLSKVYGKVFINKDHPNLLLENIFIDQNVVEGDLDISIVE